MRIVGSFLLGIALAPIAQKSGPQPADAGKVPERIEIRGIENTFRLSPKLYSGGDARGVEALSALKNLGIKTIISVDGSTPDVETARNLGLRYVHLPIGYDGVPRDQALKAIRALKTLPGPVYIHCHHGQHRGPAAAAVCGIATEGWSRDDALAWLKAAGTSPDYQGLYKSAREFVPPSAEELAAIDEDLPELTEPEAIVDLMIRIDERWDTLKASQKVGFQPTPRQPDIDPSRDALQLVELYRELARLPGAEKRGPAFLKAIGSAERDADGLEQALRTLRRSPTPEAAKRAESAFLASGKVCSSCHAAHRNPPR